MAKTVFRPNEITKSDSRIMLELSKKFVEDEPEEEIIEEEVYEGPTADDLRREAEAFRQQWEIEKQRMMDEAREQADKILKDAEAAAFEEVKRQTDQAQVIKSNAEQEAALVVQQAQEKANELLSQAETQKETCKTTAYNEGFEKGHEAGYKEGKTEVQRLIDRLHTMIERIMDKRQDILEQTEQQVVDLVLLVSRKVVKVISDNQRNVVMANIVQALRKVKGRGDVNIHVNLADIGLTTEHIKEFTASVESVKSITVIEDSSVDKGGCIIETDFGSIDARISSQLNELEQKILEISPIKMQRSSMAAASAKTIPNGAAQRSSTGSLN